MKTREQALRATSYAIQKGQLIRPEVCELCDIDTGKLPKLSYTRIIAHHWRGYDYPLDVWFICRSCNMILRNRHDASLTKDQAKQYVSYSARWYDKPDYRFEYLSAAEFYEA